MKKGYFNFPSNCPGMGSLTIVYNVGAITETEGYRGISHLTEHLLCGSVKNLEEKMHRFGINYNASTGGKRTQFYIEGLDKNLKLFEEDFLKLIDHIPTKEQFEKEKQIVLREYDDAFTSKNSLYYNIWRSYYDCHSSIGVKKDIEEITYEKFLEFRNTWFEHPTAIIRVGETDIQDLYEKVECKEYQQQSYERCLRNIIPETNYSSSRYYCVEWIDSSLDSYLVDSIITYLKYGLESPIMKRFRDELGLVYNIEMFDVSVGDSRCVSISYEADGKTRKKIHKELKKLFSEKDLINQERFEAVVDIIKSVREQRRIFNYNNDEVMNFYDEIEEDYEMFEKMTYELFSETIKTFLQDFLKNGRCSYIQRKIKI